MDKPTDLQENTTVSQVDVNIDELFGMPGADSVLLPEDETKKTVFTNDSVVDTEFLDKKETVTVKSDETSGNVAPPVNVEETISELDTLIEEQETGSTVGRPKTDKSALLELATKMIEEGTLIPFEDDKPIEEYTAADFRELFEANFQERESKIKEEIPRQFFESLPQELQLAAKYVADGGKDLRGLFKTLAQVEEIRTLDPDDSNDQAEIARQYLSARGFGTPEEIEAEIEDWADLGKLAEKAAQFKPKLDQMQEQIVAKRLAEQEQLKMQQEEAAKVYTDNVYNTLVKGEIGGIKLDKKTQSLLYSGLTQPSYPSLSGRQTNLLGHLLEKYQFVEPNHDLIAEALWLLADPTAYKENLKKVVSKEEVAKTVRALKTEESRKITSSTHSEEDVNRARPTVQKTITKKNNNPFKRF